MTFFLALTFKLLYTCVYLKPHCFVVCVSALVGYATTIIPRAFTYYASSILFAIFGLKMLKEGKDFKILLLSSVCLSLFMSLSHYSLSLSLCVYIYVSLYFP